MGSRFGLYAVEKRKIPCPCRESNPGRPARSIVTTLRAIVTKIKDTIFPLRVLIVQRAHNEPYFM
jgi:hypothetical protein